MASRHFSRSLLILTGCALVSVLSISICFAGTTHSDLQSDSTPSTLPADAEIRQLLVRRIDDYKQSVGIVVGVIDVNGRRIISYGNLENGDKRPLNGDTLFEIGSITKIFTALLLADMAQHGEVRLDEPIAKYLPPNVSVPERDGRQITLVDLATHTSGLPLMPKNFRPKNPEDPYSGYSEEKLYSFLSTYRLTGDIGVSYEYSNVGYGLLGQGLAFRAGGDYGAVVERRICKPLGMLSTKISLSPASVRRLASGHSANLQTVSRWEFPVLAGTGALLSSANDLLKFLSAAMGFTHSRLDPALRSMLSITRSTGQPSIDSALGWLVDTRSGNSIIWKNGRTGGYRTFIGFDPRSLIGVVALSNTSYGNFGVDDLGLHLLNASYPLTDFVGSAHDATVNGTGPGLQLGH